jgi:hypothetical protein
MLATLILAQPRSQGLSFCHDSRFVAKNLRILKFSLLKYYVGKKCKIPSSHLTEINFTNKNI